MEGSIADGAACKRSTRRKVVVHSYNEKLVDELLDKQLGVLPGKKRLTREELEKETETEAMIAFSLGFPIDALLEEEIRYGVVRELGGKEQNDYIVVRNHILARWRNNVGIWLTKGQIRETVCSESAHLISASYDFLFYNGHINFGVLPSLITNEPQETVERSVIIVGAGLAGLAAARQLLSFGFNVIILEGRSRAGGRVYTQRMGQKDNYAAVDLGGSVITGIHANPLGVLARQLSIPLHKVRDKCPLYRPDGALVDEQVDAKVEFIFNRLLDRVMELRKVKDTLSHDISLGDVLERLRQLYSVARNYDEKQLLDWHLANLEYANAGCLSDLSAAYWDQDDPFEMGGDHCFLAGGNGRLIKALSDGIPIFFNKTVNAIRYGNEGVEVTAGKQVFRADAVLCTMPLGVLKKKVVLFEPELPPRKVAAIDRLGFGLLDKVAMVFPYVFWGEDLDTFGCLREDKKKRGEFFLFYSYHTVSGAAALIALVAGEAAQAFELEDPYSIVHRLMTILRGIYKPKGIDVPDPLQTICTRWGSDPLSHGSYSHIRVNSSGKDYEILAENVGNRLFFAGEATTRQYPATMHGAFLSGLREASRIFGASGSWQSNLVKTPPKHIRNCESLLSRLFKNPDLAFGNFALILDRPLNGQKPMGILRVNFENSCSTDITKPPLQLYTVLSEEEAHRLQLVTEGDDLRLLYLNKTLKLTLMGIVALVNCASSLIASIASSKKSRCRGRPSSRHQNSEHNS